MKLHRVDDGTPLSVYSGNGRLLGTVAKVSEAYRVLYVWLNASVVYQSGQLILRHDDWNKEPTDA
jgi:hypothetical protein